MYRPYLETQDDKYLLVIGILIGSVGLAIFVVNEILVVLSDYILFASSFFLVGGFGLGIVALISIARKLHYSKLEGG